MSVFLEPLASYTITSGNTGNLGLANIPQQFTDLMLIAQFRCYTGSNNVQNLWQWFNNDGSNLNTATRLWGYAGSTTANYEGATFPSVLSLLNGGGSPANTFTSATMYIPNYTSNFAKQFIFSSGSTTNGTNQYTYRVAGRYNSTNPITAIAWQNDAGGFAAGTSIDLYGILRKGV